MNPKSSFDASVFRPIASRGRIPTGGVDSISFNDEYSSLSARSISTDSNDSGAGLSIGIRQRKNMQPVSKVVFDDYSSVSSPDRPHRKRGSNASDNSVKTVLQHSDSAAFASPPRPASNRVAPGGRTTIILG